MKQSLTHSKTPMLAGVVREKTERAAIAEIYNCLYDGADMIDLHMSCMEDTSVETLKRIISASKLPVLALNYNKTYDWQDAGIEEEERVASFWRAVEAGADGVDIQGYTFHRPSKDGFYGEDKYSFTANKPFEVVTDPEIISQQCDFIDRVHYAGAQVLLSCHPHVEMNTQQLVDLALFLEQRNPDIIKIVTVADTEDALLESFRAMMALKREVKTPVSYHAGGKMGNLSRIINPMLGGHIAFCTDRFTESSLMAQPDLRAVKAVLDNLGRII